MAGVSRRGHQVGLGVPEPVFTELQRLVTFGSPGPSPRSHHGEKLRRREDRGHELGELGEVHVAGDEKVDARRASESDEIIIVGVARRRRPWGWRIGNDLRETADDVDVCLRLIDGKAPPELVAMQNLVELRKKMRGDHELPPVRDGSAKRRAGIPSGATAAETRTLTSATPRVTRLSAPARPSAAPLAWRGVPRWRVASLRRQ